MISFVLLVLGFSIEPVYADNRATFFNNSENKILVEVPSSAISVHCTKPDGDDPDTASFTYVTLTLDDELHDFIFRRPWSLGACEDRRRQIRKVLKGSKRVRIFGFHRMAAKYDPEPDNDGVRPPLPKGRKMYSWIFEFIDNKQGDCHSYFTHVCKEREQEIEALPN